MVPEAVDHVGVIVFGYLYEYGDLGILKTVVSSISVVYSSFLHITFLARVRVYVTALSVRPSVTRHDRARTRRRIWTKIGTYVYLTILLDEFEDGHD